MVQELRKNKRRIQKCGEVNPFSGMVYCADCGKKMYLCRSKSLNADQEHLKCSAYAGDKDACTAHFIRTAVLSEIVIRELNSVLAKVKDNEEAFVKSALEKSQADRSSELKKAAKTLSASEKRIAELDRLFTRLYEDNVSGKISDERFKMMSAAYEDEQKKLKELVSELTAFMEKSQQKATETAQFIQVVRKYEEITKLTPEIMHELIEKIIIHAPDKSSGRRKQKIEIHFRFHVATSIAVADSMDYDKKRKAA